MAKWVYDRPGHYYCSGCKTMWTNTAKWFFKYCPSCGTKMENARIENLNIDSAAASDGENSTGSRDENNAAKPNY